MPSYCACRHLQDDHRSMAVTATKTTVEFCERCASCTGFTPGPTPLRVRRQAVADEATAVAATDGGANDEPATVAATPLLVDDHTGDVYWPTDPAAPGTLIRAWTSYRCERCEAMTWTSEPVCCRRPMVPVTVEVHSRESP